MKFNRFQSVTGVIFLALAGIVLSQYQNCAPSGGGGNAFVLGSNTTNNNGTDGLNPGNVAMTAQPLTLPGSSFQVGTPVIASSVLVGTIVTGTCAWEILSGTTAVSTVSSIAVNGVCTLSGLNAPSTVGSYTLQLAVNNGTDPQSTVSASFSTTAAPPPLTVTAGLAASPVSGYENLTTFSFTGSAVANYAEIFTISFGSISGGVKTQFCTYTSTQASTSYTTPACAMMIATLGLLDLYVDVTVNGALTDCQTVSGACTGNYVISTRVFTGGGGGGGGGGCFVAGTPVETPNGEVPIEKIKVGDKVFSYDTNTGKTVIGEVGKVLVHKNFDYGTLELADGTQFQLTAEHSFYLPDKKIWMAAGRLKPGDHVLKGRDERAAPLTIKSVDFSKTGRGLDVPRTTVYNFHVKKYMNYYVKDVLVHNIKLPDPPTTDLRQIGR